MVTALMNLDEYWRAVASRDANHDGAFVFAVSTTGVYCRPSCPSRRPRRENTAFYRTCEAAERAGYRACLRCRPKSLGAERPSRLVQSICRYIERHLDDPLTLAVLGNEFKMSPFHLQRIFKSAVGVSPKQYADSCRMKLVKQRLQEGHNVTRALYDAGYSSSSRLYERTASQLGMTPDKYRRGAVAANILYTCVSSPLGRMLLAATDRGICAIHFAATDEELVQGLQREFPFALRKQDDAGPVRRIQWPWRSHVIALYEKTAIWVVTVGGWNASALCSRWRAAQWIALVPKPRGSFSKGHTPLRGMLQMPCGTRLLIATRAELPKRMVRGHLLASICR